MQEKEIIRLGSNEPQIIDVRLIVATNKNLEKAIKENKFREDLYYRLNVVAITLPPLRERKEDIPQLVRYFIKKFSREGDKEIIDVNNEAMEKLISYNWPGNIRELENVMKRACVLCKGTCILAGELLLESKDTVLTKADGDKNDNGLEQLLDQLYKKISYVPKKEREDIMPVIEKGLLMRALKETEGNQLKAARILGINRNTLRNKIEKYGIKINREVES